MSVMVRLAVIAAAVLFFSNIAVAQFLPEDQIPLEIQSQIIADVIAEHGHLDMAVLETAFREWLLSQPLPDADGVMLDAGTCSDCSPPTDGEDLQFPPVRDVEIVTREGRIRPSFKVRWRRPMRLPREIRDLYELDSYEVFLTRDDGVFEHHQITKELRADGTERLPRRIRFRRRDPGVYMVHVRPVYVEVEQSEAASSSGPVSGSALAGSTGKTSSPATRGGFGTGGGKGPWGGGGPAPLSPTDSVQVAFDNSPNTELEKCILDRLHFGIRTLPNGGTVQGYFDYTEATLLQEIDFLDCSDPDTNPNHGVISSIAQLDNFTILRSLNLAGNDVSDLGTLSDLVSLEQLDVSDNHNVQINDINALDALTHLTLDGIDLGATGLPSNFAVSSLLKLSLVDTNLKTVAFNCNDPTEVNVSFLDISSNSLADENLSLLAVYPATSLNASDNRFTSFSNPCPSNPVDLFVPISSLDLSDNGGNIGFGGSPFSDDISSNVLSSLNLSDSNFTRLPAQMSEVCIDLNISEMDNLTEWLLTDTTNIPQGRPYTFNLNNDNALLCEDSQNFRYWAYSRGTNTAAGCPILGLAYSELFANDCDPKGDLNLRVERNGENQHHVLNWDGLLLEGEYRDFEYQLQKRFAGIHDPNSDDGIIGTNYEYGEVASAVISDTDNGLAYEFRIQQCVQNTGGQECGPWSAWVEGDYPLIRPINTQVTWTDPVNGHYFLTWAYPQSYFDGHGDVEAFYLEYPLSGQTEFVSVGAHQSIWQSAVHTVASHGTVVRISACSEQNNSLTCGPAVVMNLSLPPELGANLTAPNVINSSIDPVSQNELTITLQNMTPGVDPDDASTIVDYYEVIEDGPTADRTYFFDVSQQPPGAQSTHKIKRYVGGEDYSFNFKACVRNRNGADICSASSPALVQDFAEPLAFNVIGDSLCWVDRSGDGSGLNVQLEWQYSTAGGSAQPSHYLIDTFSDSHQFVIDHASHTNASGVTVVNQTLPPGNLPYEFWEVHGCPDASGSSCQSLGFIGAQPGQPECTNPTLSTVETFESGGPDDLRPGVWTSDDLPRQGWTFYWASDLRYDDVHIEYGDTYDLFAYWQTFQFNDVTSTWDAVWLYSELKQILDTDTGSAVCDDNGPNTSPLGFQGALYYPDAGLNTADMNVGDLVACFDPENNSMVDIHLDITTDPGLDSGGQQSFELSEISGNSDIFPPPGSLGPNQQDYLNGSFGLNSTSSSIGKTRLISWSYSFLEGLIVLGFDDAGKPMWMNGTLDCRDTGVTCDAVGVDGRPSLTSASFDFRTARLGLPPFAEIPSEEGFENVAASINGILRTKHGDATDTGNEFEVGGFLSFGFSNDENVPIRSFNHNFTETVVRESSFHDIRYWVDDEQSAEECNIVDGVCEIRLTWFSDADFLGDGTPSIKAFYVHSNDTTDVDVMDGVPMNGAFCGAGDPAVAFTVTDYVCQISSPGNYRFMLVNRLDAAGLPTNESNIIAISGTLNVLGEGTNANDDLGVADVGDTPLQAGVTAHNHDQVTHAPSIGAVAGQAGVSGGAATYSVPINIPPGRQGMQPSVSLSYNSRAGNGRLGMGWSLSAGSSISRCPSTIAQDGFTKGVTYDDTDRLCLDGQRLMLVSGSYWAPGSQYRTEIDSFALVTLNGAIDAATDGCGNTFTVRSKDNIERNYGVDATAKVSPDLPLGSSCAVVNSWLLSKQQDPAGNDIRYEYDDMTNGEHLLKTIRYTGNTSAAGDRRVVFNYSARPANDQSTSYLGGYRTRQTQQLNNIQTFVGSDQVRQYNLGYDTSTGTSRLLLETVEECAYENGAQAACLPETMFEWGDQAPSYDSWAKLQTDQDGDGTFEDLLPGGVDPLTPFDDDGFLRPSAGELRQTFDIDGDGSRELIFSTPGRSFITSINAEREERWRAELVRDAGSCPNRSSQDDEIILAQVRDENDAAWRAEQQRPNIQRYVNSLDLETKYESETGEKPSSNQVETFASQLVTTLEDELAIYYLTRRTNSEANSVDFNTDGINDLFGFVDDGQGQSTFNFFISSSSDLTSTCFDDHFITVPTTLQLSSTESIAARTMVGDVNGDSLEDVILRVLVRVTDNDGDSYDQQALQLWINAGENAQGVVVYNLYDGADEVSAVDAAGNDVEGIIYIWPYNIFVENAPVMSNQYIPEVPSDSFFTDINGDGLSDIVINSDLSDIAYTFETADLEIPAVIQFGFSDANARVLVNKGAGASIVNLELVEYSDDSTVLIDDGTRGDTSLGIYSDPRQTYLLPMDVNGDGLSDYLMIPNRDSDNNSICVTCWYVQINLGQSANSDVLYSAPILLEFLDPVQDSMNILDNTNQPTLSPVNPPEFGSLIQPVDWNNDGQTELMIPRSVDKPICVSMLHNRTDNANEGYGVYCPTQMNGTTPSGPRTPNQGEDFNGFTVANGNPHTFGLGHLDRSTYHMGILELTVSDDMSRVHASLVDAPETGLIANVRSRQDDAFGDGIGDVLTIHGCQVETSTPVGPGGNQVPGNMTRCTDSPIGYTDQTYTDWFNQHPDNSDALDNRGYYITRNTAPRDQVLDLMLSATDGFDNRSDWSYAPLSSNPPERVTETDIPLYVMPNRSNGDDYLSQFGPGYFYFASSMYVVGQFDQSNGIDCDLGAACMGSAKLQNTTYYGYEEAVYNGLGRGFQGFRKIVSEQVVTDPVTDDSANNLRSVSVFHQVFPLAGRLEATYTQLASINYEPMDDRATDGSFSMPLNTLSSGTYDWGCRIGSGDINGPGQIRALCDITNASGIDGAIAQVTETISGVPGVFHPVMSSSDSKQKEIGTSNTAGALYASSEQTDRSYDGYGNMLAGTTISDNFSAGVNVLEHTQTVTNTFVNDDSSSNWWLGQLTSVVTEASNDYLDGNAASEQSKIATQLFGYNSPYVRRPDCQQTVDGDPGTVVCGNAGGIWSRTQTVYNTDGNPTMVTVTANNLPTPRVTTMDYTDDGYFPDMVTNAEGHIVITEIDAREGNPTRVMDANDLITRMSYDPFGRALETWYPQAGAADTPNGANLIAQHYAPRSSVRYSAGCVGMPTDNMAYCMTTITDGAPVVRQGYDSLNRVLRTHSAGFGGTTATVEQTYNARGQMVADTVPRYTTGSTYTSEYLYDALGRMTFKVQPRQTMADTSVQHIYSHYMHAGLTTTVVVGNDPMQPLCAMEEGDLTTGTQLCVERTYASNGWLLSTKDAHGYTTGFWYDGQGNPVLIEDASQTATSDGNFTSAVYNNLGHRTSLSDPNMGDWSYSYNGLGEVIGQTDANDVVFTFDYDDLGRLTNRTASCPAGSANSTMNDSWHYDAMPNTKGLLDRSVRSDCDLAQTTRSYAYDVYNRPTTMAQVISNNPNSTVSRMRVESGYDSYFARQASMTWYVDSTGSGFADTPLVRQYNKYDINGYLVEQGDSRQYVGDTAANYNVPGVGAGTWRHIEQMTPNGQIIEQQFGNDLVQTNQYFDATWQLHNSFIPDLQPDSPELMNYFYEYDLFGNITQQTSHSLVQAGGDTTMNHEQFSYDRLHRLVNSNRVHYVGGNMTGSSDISYEYDELGNIKDKTDFATNYQYFDQRCEGGTRPNAVNVVNRVMGGGLAAYTYDCNGNMLTGPDKRIDYNAYNKPTRIANASNIATNEFWYDADEQRYLQRKGVTTTVYLDKMYERTGNVHKLYIDDFAVFTIDYQNSGEDTGITYLHTDRLGSVAVMSRANGDPVANASRGFDPFGKPREGDWQNSDGTDNSTGQSGDLNGYDETTRGFTGHEHMNESDLIHMNGRAYDYNLGRFLSVDPFIQFPTNSQSLNPYSYILNNPMAGTDPTGYTCNPVDGVEACSGGNTGQERSGTGPGIEMDSGHLQAPDGGVNPSSDGLKRPSERRNPSDQRNEQEEEQPKELERINAVTPGEVIPDSGFGAGDRVRGGDRTRSRGLSIPNRFSAFTLIFYSGGLANSECPPGGCTFMTQAEIDAMQAGIAGIRGPSAVLNESDEDNGAAGELPDLTGLSEEEAEAKLKENGFVKDGKTAGGYDKWKHPDGSRVQVRPDGEITRTGPKIQNPDPNARGYRPRIGPDGKRLTPDQSHNTGEIIIRK